MTRRLLLLFSVAVCLLVFAGSASPAHAQVHPAEAEAAIRYHFDWDEEDFAVAVSQCETGLGLDIYNEGSGAHGILQITPDTAAAMRFNYYRLADPWYSAWAAKRLHDYWESLGYWGFDPWVCAY